VKYQSPTANATEPWRLIGYSLWVENAGKTVYIRLFTNKESSNKFAQLNKKSIY
jgi:hypothetical protein